MTRKQKVAEYYIRLCNSRRKEWHDDPPLTTEEENDIYKHTLTDLRELIDIYHVVGECYGHHYR
jgi:hypothetical protein